MGGWELQIPVLLWRRGCCRGSVLVLVSAARSGLLWTAWTHVVPKSRMGSACRAWSEAEMCAEHRSRVTECAMELPVVSGLWMVVACVPLSVNFFETFNIPFLKHKIETVQFSVMLSSSFPACISAAAGSGQS